MRKKRRTEIIIETRQLIFLKSTGNPAKNFCAECGSELFKPEAVALVSGIGTREIYRRVENNTIYFIETPDGHLLVCLHFLTIDETHGA